MKHISVLLQEAIEQLAIKPDGVYVDVTLGSGGHSREILAGLESGRLIGFDVDSSMHPLAGVNDNKQFTFINQNFAHLKSELAQIGINQIDGLLADLGWSTDQLGNTKGLSFDRPNENLDMRLNPQLTTTASDILNSISQTDLEKMLLDLAGSNYKESKLIAKQIVTARNLQSISTVGELNEILNTVDSRRSHNILRRVYQALRIVVNGELDSLRQLVAQVAELLVKNGRLVVITFHSLEEEVLIESANQTGLSVLGNPIRPSVKELRQNISARSAKLWTLIKNENTKQ